MNKATALAVFVAVGFGFFWFAVIRRDIAAAATGGAFIGGAIGYLVGRVDLRKELGLPLH